MKCLKRKSDNILLSGCSFLYDSLNYIRIYFIGRVICAIKGCIRVWAADAKSDKVSPSMKCKFLSVAFRKTKYIIFVHAFHDRVRVKCNKEWTDVIELAEKDS